jgi:hypothetical protein
VLCHTLADVQNRHDRTTGPRGEAVRAYLPLAVYLAGLPSLPERIRSSGSTFFERALTFDLGLLRDPDVARRCAACSTTPASASSPTRSTGWSP